jgi:hypothetical protein
MGLSEGASHLMEVQPNLKAACMKEAVILENKDQYVLGTNMIRAVFGCRAEDYGSPINVFIFINEGKKKVLFTLGQAMNTHSGSRGVALHYF